MKPFCTLRGSGFPGIQLMIHSSSTISPTVAVHGASRLLSVGVNCYNVELKDDETFLGERASKGAFRDIIENCRKPSRKIGVDPFGDEPSRNISKEKLDALLSDGSSEAARIVHGAIEDFAQELATVIRRFLKLEAWLDTECIVVGGGLRATRVGERAIGRASVILQPGISTAFWRSVGPSHNVFVTESFIDELAATAKQDPVAYRLALLEKNPRAKAVLQLAAEKAGWGQPLPERVGRGVSLQFVFATYMAQVAEVEVAKNGEARVRRVVCAVDCGTAVNPDTIQAQIQSAIIFGITAALYGQITLKDGRVEQSNFDTYQVLRMRRRPSRSTSLRVPSRRAGWASAALRPSFRQWPMQSLQPPPSGCARCPSTAQY